MTEAQAINAPFELRSLLATMKSAKAQRVGMAIWDRDVKAVEDAISTIEAVRARTPAPGEMELADELNACKDQNPDLVKVVSDVLCKSKVFETGQGTCALVCMDQLGDPRKRGCWHATRVHDRVALAILEALVPHITVLRTAAQSAVRERTITTVQEKLVDQKFCWCIVRVLHDEEIIQNFGSGLDARVAAFRSFEKME
jgi:hypothetical protein